MTDSETITLNECMNDMSCVHLYYSADTDLWQAFGLSAYMLEQFAADCGIGRIVDYSRRLMMPSVTLPASGLQTIVSASGLIQDDSDGHIILHPNIHICKKGYLPWVKDLRGAKMDIA